MKESHQYQQPTNDPKMVSEKGTKVGSVKRLNSFSNPGGSNHATNNLKIG